MEALMPVDSNRDIPPEFTAALRSAYTVALRLLADEEEAGEATLAAVATVSQAIAMGADEAGAVARLPALARKEAVARLGDRFRRNGGDRGRPEGVV
jgi:hypothetical protein